MYFFGSKDIKNYVQKVIEARADSLNGLRVLDFPAGNGVTSALLQKVHAKVQAFDLFPEFFRVSGLECTRADLGSRFPLPDNSVDFAICQEGIEHVSDQMAVFKEFHRVLTPDGTLLVTTPNYSSLRSRLSYLLCESEIFGKLMPPNEVDSVWFAQDDGKLYFGHVNLIGIQRLRLFANLAKFKIRKIHATRVNMTSVILFPLFYPLILVFSYLSMRRFRRKHNVEQFRALQETYALMVDPKVLLMSHLMIEFEKTAQPVYIHNGRQSQETLVT